MLLMPTNLMATGIGREVPMFWPMVHRCVIPPPIDFFPPPPPPPPPPYPPFHGPPPQVFLNDIEDRRCYPDLPNIRLESSRVKFKLNMSGFNPEDIKIEVVDKFLVVRAKHEEREEEDCFITREYKRSLYLPKYVIADEVDAKLAPCGWLTVYIPLRVHYPNCCPATGGQQPMRSGDSPIESQEVRRVPIRILED